MSRTTWILTIILTLLIFVTGFLVYSLVLNQNVGPTPIPTAQALQSTSPSPGGMLITMNGKISCLPLKTGGFEDPKDCAEGLLDSSSGKYYMLFGLTTNLPAVGTNVQVRGTLRANFFGSGSDTNAYGYDVAGGIDVVSLVAK